MSKKILDLIPEGIRPQLIDEVKDYLKEQGMKIIEDAQEKISDAEVDKEITEWAQKNSQQKQKNHEI